jgi:Ca2+/Na+ antiporter
MVNLSLRRALLMAFVLLCISFVALGKKKKKSVKKKPQYNFDDPTADHTNQVPQMGLLYFIALR